MGSTVTTKKLVLGFQTSSGLRYALMERTYERNVHPHTPRWGCIALGAFEAVIERILAYASYCEGGMLQSRDGHIQPEKYLAGWYRAFRKVRHLDMETVLVSLSSADETFQTTRSLLQKRCRDDLVQALDAGTFTLSLHDDFDLIFDIYGPGRILAPWRIISPSHAVFADAMPADPSLLPTLPRPAQPSPSPTLRVLSVSDFLLYSFNGGPWIRSWSAYSLVEALVAEHLVPYELAAPGFIGEHLATFRAAASAPEVLPRAPAIDIRKPSLSDSRWQEQQYLELYEALSGESASDTPNAIRCTVEEVEAVHAEKNLRYLDSTFLTWHLDGDQARSQDEASPILSQNMSPHSSVST